MKWEPIALMVLLPVLGVWLIWVQGLRPGLPEYDENARLVDIRLGAIRGVVEIVEQPEGAEYRLLYRNGEVTEAMSGEQFSQRFGATAFEAINDDTNSGFFRLLNITSWAGLIWVAVGVGGQAAFFGRMLIQWVVSEKKRESVVPEAFWWLSLIGGVALFTYFVWRRDIVGVLGQSTGVVIYARNLRLIHKQRRRAEREALRSERQAPATA